MVLNLIWVGFFLVAILTALVRLLQGDAAVFPALMGAMFDSAKTGFEISLGLVGVMALWLGIMRVGEQAGVIDAFARLVNPLFSLLFPSVPRGHAAQGAVMMNVSANLLGLDNAATPLGLKAMRELQTLNAVPARASDAQIMFIVLNTAGLTLIPTAVIAMRQTMAAKQGLTQFNAADIFLPTLMVTAIGLLTALLAVAWVQKLPIWRPRFAAFVLGLAAFVGTALWGLSQLPPEVAARVVGTVGAVVVMGVVALFLAAGLIRRENCYEAFVEGAKEGFGVAVQIIPYLVAMLVAIGVFRAAGCMDVVLDAIAVGVRALGLDTAFLPALPVGLMKILSGSGARGLMVDVFATYGVASFPAKLAAIIQGSSETTFYVLALYFGSVGVKDTRHALPCALLADGVGIVAAILIAYAMF
ncbi:hypothetical protein CCO03_02220 [Comamonas serinivorans]|uniref:Nucleoside transporter/FeoB GTPase Gate domain-containing protein n=1 Tax=Comamonas serinivorans TaxID=1082851 RepID=A0A1Y0EJW9_9BURK|nr:spore maturation protein [Comamonas serinivorans]ARU03659.1 hypothetical protein CCO03_02220 [Comamonas serinivorans]